MVVAFKILGVKTSVSYHNYLKPRIDLLIGKHQFWMQPNDIFTNHFVGYFKTFSIEIDG